MTVGASQEKHNIFRWYRAGWGGGDIPRPIRAGVGSDTNLYTYVGQNPARFVDPFGLVPFDQKGTGDDVVGRSSLNPCESAVFLRRRPATIACRESWRHDEHQSEQNETETGLPHRVPPRNRLWVWIPKREEL